MNYVKAHQLLPDVLRHKLEQEGANVLTVEMLTEVIRSLSELDAIARDDVALFFEPPSIDDRIVNSLPSARS